MDSEVPLLGGNFFLMCDAYSYQVEKNAYCNISKRYVLSSQILKSMFRIYIIVLPRSTHISYIDITIPNIPYL